MIKKGTKIGWILVAASALLAIWLLVVNRSSAADNEAFTISGNILTKYDESKMTGTTPYSVEVPDSVTSIGESAFASMENTSSVSMANNTVTSLGEGVFAGSSSLTRVTLSTGITEIPARTFQETALSSINIPSNVTTIGSQAFANTDLSTITIPANVSTIASDAFSDNQNLTAVNVESANSTFESVNGALYTKGGTLKFVPIGISSLTVKEGTTVIGANALERSTMTEFTVPESVKTIGENAFTRSSIKKLTVLSDDVNFGDQANWADNSTIVYGHQGSTVQQYCLNNGIQFVVLGDDSSTKYTVKFDPNGGTIDGSTAVASYSVVAGDVSPVPTAVRDGYTFSGWTSSVNGVGVDDAINTDVTFTATWVKNAAEGSGSYVVAFDVNGGSPKYKEQTVSANGKVTNPGNPSRDGYTFIGWYNGEAVWDFNSNTVTSNMTLTAWYRNNSTGSVSRGTGNSATGGSGGTSSNGGTRGNASGGHTKDATPKTAGPIDARYFLVLAIFLAGVSVLLYSKHSKLDYVAKNKK
ncbi:MAG: leucine-rich repeat protein [Lachnospiraceae bacterium]|nr:leucine-rich repeat protein [Lachnospiraceae bacterium]